MADNYNELAKDILEHVGGEENVQNVRHCITRLRFNLKDESIADTEYLKNRDGIVTIMKSSGQYQVVIGQHVGEVYDAMMAVSSLDSDGESEQTDDVTSDDRNLMEKFIDFISGVFQPFLMPLAATGMIKGLVALLGTFGVESTSGLYQVLNFAGDGFFQFLPVMVAITAARKLKMNQFTALAVAVAFLHPAMGELTQGEVLFTLFEGTAFASPIYATLLGIPIILPPNGYYMAIIPIIAAVWFSSYVERFFKNSIPKVVNSFLTPFFTILITVPISLLLIGPVANWGSALIGVFFTWLSELSPVIFGAVLGAAWQLLVIFGLHWGIVPIGYLLLAEQGINPIGAAYMVSTFGVLGVVIALLIKSNSKRIKDVGIPGAISLLFGVSEPTIYGLMLPMKRSFAYALIGNAVGGAYAMLTGTVFYRTGGLGVFSIFNALDPSGAITMNLWNIIIAFIISAGVAFALQMIFPVPALEGDGQESDISSTTPPTVSESELQESAKEEIIASPLTGRVLPLEDTPDEVFSSGALGKGITIEPTIGKVVAPTNGIVSALFETEHAIGITTDLGAELLIHIGIDTVEMEGLGFKALVAKDQNVEAGQTLIEFDIDAIKTAGYSPLVPIIVTNTDQYTEVVLTSEEQVTDGDYLLTTIK